MNTTEFDTMGKAELRAACKVAAVKGYGNMTTQAMRDALVALSPVAKPAKVSKPKVKKEAAPAPVQLVEPVAEVVEPVAEVEVEVEADTPVFNVMGSMFGQLVAAPAPVVAQPAKVTRVVDGKRVVEGVPSVARESRVAPPRVATVRTGYTIEKERVVQNGVKHPSAGTICAAIWGYFTTTPSAKASLLDDIADSHGWDRTTVHVQFYVWRKFNGIKGRQAA